MATHAVPVDASKKDEPGVKEVTTHIPGVGPVQAYFKVVTTDDYDGKTEKDVETFRFSSPILLESEQEVIGEDGEPEKNDDGSTKLEVVKLWKTVAYEIDLGEGSRDKLVAALAPFVEKAREVAAPITATPVRQTSSGPSHDLNAIREWAKSAGHDVKDKGRVAAKVIEAYYNSTGKPNPESTSRLL
ncbi:histone-like nucleoid-structuring protein Lsr2 [Streptomyces fragilis]|uniref:Lsr2 family protein n=1 Tax=Streptomyces fragilis TaxID=67301 RepID=A0ABV2YAG6_9ACTN|nr:Lsr2 family protein [Streptomyces fragilis]